MLTSLTAISCFYGRWMDVKTMHFFMVSIRTIPQSSVFAAFTPLLVAALLNFFFFIGNLVGLVLVVLSQVSPKSHESKPFNQSLPQ